MENFAIFRFEKVKSLSSLSAQQNHVFRRNPTPNADEKLTPFNPILFGEKDAVSGIRRRVEEVKDAGKRVRVDATLAVEILLTASPEFFEPRDYDKEKEWLDANISFLKTQFGELNIIQAVLHQDEKTPHIHAICFPRTEDGRLSAREVFGGPQDLRVLQTKYADAMKRFGLRRGHERSKAKHEEIRKAYCKVLRESEENLRHRISKSIAHAYTPR
jgi:hypothetical protein